MVISISTVWSKKNRASFGSPKLVLELDTADTYSNRSNSTHLHSRSRSDCESGKLSLSLDE
jgi:hypothetical protein